MNKYLTDRRIYNASSNSTEKIIFENNTTSEYVPFYSILNDYYLMNLGECIVKNKLKSKAEDILKKYKNQFLIDFIAFGIDRLVQLEKYETYLKNDAFLDSIINSLKTILIDPIDLKYVCSALCSSTQSTLIEKLQGSLYLQHIEGYVGPMFMSTSEKQVLFSLVIKRSNVYKARLNMIKTGNWDLSLFELWISKGFLNLEYTKIDNFLKEMISETNVETKIVDNFKSIFSPNFTEFKTIKERKEFLTKFEDEIKANIKEEIKKVFSINQKAQEKAIKKIQESGLYLKEWKDQKITEKI
jgi:hypothetical protein